MLKKHLPERLSGFHQWDFISCSCYVLVMGRCGSFPSVFFSLGPWVMGKIMGGVYGSHGRGRTRATPARRKALWACAQKRRICLVSGSHMAESNVKGVEIPYLPLEEQQVTILSLFWAKGVDSDGRSPCKWWWDGIKVQAREVQDTKVTVLDMGTGGRGRKKC